MICTILALFIFASTLAAEPAELVRLIRTPQLEPDRAVSLRNVELEIGIAVMEIERGVLIPTAPIDGRTLELVFIGQARFRCDPGDDVEAGQMELFTGQRALDAAVEEAVLVLAGEETVSTLLERPAPHRLRPELITRAEKLLQDWLEKTARRSSGIELALFKSLVGDAAFSNYFAVWCRSHEVGDFVYQLDTEDVEHLTVASFVPLDVQGWERRRLKRHIRIQQRKGRWLGVDVEDLGAWDVWLSKPWTPASGRSFPGNVGFETEHYTIDATIRRHSLILEGEATLDITAQAGGRRVVSLELFRDLQVQRVTDGDGEPLFHMRSGRELAVLLPSPSVAGEKLTLKVSYGGRVLKWVGRGTYDLEDTSNWYPHCGTIDRASYDVTLQWPAKYELISGGRLVEEGRRGRYRWERRLLELPSIAASFVLGDFLVERRQCGHIELTMAFDRGTPIRLTERIRTRALDTVEAALGFFEEVFGPYPLDHLAIAILPRDYSQSYLGFITLTDSVVRLDPPRTQTAWDWFRNTTIAHETAHQWWGNLLGWWSYRDQWLSEAMANYSAMIFYREQEGEKAASLSDLSAGWLKSLSRTTMDGRTIESLGPIVLGARLNSSVANNGYGAIVYRKGAMVLAMLARTMGEERFLAMLRSLVEAAAHRVISTEDFLGAIERMSGEQLDGFARQFIYGTGIPHIYYEYDTARTSSDGWIVRGEARRFTPVTYELSIERVGRDRWDLRRKVENREEPHSSLAVPYWLKGEEVSGGSVLLSGRRSAFEISSDHEPAELVLDPLDEILARFFSSEHYPKRVRRFRANDFIKEGRHDEAEASLEEALERPAASSDRYAPLPWLYDQETELLHENARIRLELARLFLDQGRRAEALAELDAVEESLGPSRAVFRMARDSHRSRLEVVRGDYQPAYRRLKKTLRLAAPRRNPRSWRAVLWRAHLSSESLAMKEAYALLAVAAFETGHREDYRWALREAEERGVDMSPLKEMAGNL
jgi:tetratricopeptide (TPR) repeat protein